MKKILITFAAAILAFSAYAQVIGRGSSQSYIGGYTYYVNSVNGSSSSPGTSFGRPFANLTDLPTLTSGQSVCLVTGSYWRQFIQIGSVTPVSNFTITGCGPGALPIIDASDIISPGNNNHFVGVSNWYINNVNYNTLAAWRTATSQDGASDTSGSGVSACS